MKTHIDKLRNPNYLGGWDLINEKGVTVDIVVTIKKIDTELVFTGRGEEQEPKIVVHFNECKPIILNATNRRMLKRLAKTPFIEEMVGVRIQLTTKKVKAFGEIHDAIRIVPISTPAKAVDVNACLNKLTTAKTLSDLAKVWEVFTPGEKSTPQILAKKDELKNILK